jgi:NADPH-dependent 2,4-dienoyl-CoA reductase/sulfur reductase-like enzyme
MRNQVYPYVIVGGGLAGHSAIKGIREHDEDSPILLLSAENYLPYDRPPLTKELWWNDKTVDEIVLQSAKDYEEQGVELCMNTAVVGIDPATKTFATADGREGGFAKLLLATGGAPRALPVPGGDLPELAYYRYLEDYLRMRAEVEGGGSLLIIGGGFIGSEIAASLSGYDLDITMLYPEDYLGARVFPEDLGFALQTRFEEQGLRMFTGDKASSLDYGEGKFLVTAASGRELTPRLVLAGIGITPATELAEQAGLEVENGILVDEMLRSSAPDIYAAGDNANFPYAALGERRRIEHWDHARSQGKAAGANMAGAGKPYTYMPYFFSDLFEFGYEAVGDCDSRLETFADWQQEYEKGVIYYLRDGYVRGAMMCNVWKKVKAARELIRSGEKMGPDDLRGALDD